MSFGKLDFAYEGLEFIGILKCKSSQKKVSKPTLTSLFRPMTPWWTRFCKQGVSNPAPGELLSCRFPFQLQSNTPG